MFTRRSFLTLIGLAPVAVKVAPDAIARATKYFDGATGKTTTLDAINSTTLEYLNRHALEDNFFRESPMFYRFNGGPYSRGDSFEISHIDSLWITSERQKS